MNTLQLSLADIILALLQSLFMRVVLVVLLLATNKDKYMRGNHSFNRGPLKSILRQDESAAEFEKCWK